MRKFYVVAAVTNKPMGKDMQNWVLGHVTHIPVHYAWGMSEVNNCIQRDNANLWGYIDKFNAQRNSIK